MTLATDAPRSLGSGLLRGMGALAGAEMLNRLTRIVTAIVLGRMLGVEEFGMAAAAIIASELLRVITQTGLGARVIQCADSELEEVSQAAYRLNWAAYGIVFAGHAAVAYPVASWAGDPRIGLLILLMGLPMLAYPLATIQVFRVQRANDMGFVARMLAMQTVLDNLLTAALALAGWGIWSVAIPKLIVAVTWILAYRRRVEWRPASAATALPYRSTLAFGLTVLASELVSALRLHADKFIIGALAGLQLLGTWFFAFNAGIGLSSSVIIALSTAVLPHAAALPRDASYAGRMMRALGAGLLVTTPVILLQALAAPYYVPVLFGSHWQPAAQLVSVLCISAIGLPAMRFSAMLLRAVDAPRIELALSSIHAALSATAILATVAHGLEPAAWALAAVNLASAPIFVVITFITIRRRSFAP